MEKENNFLSNIIKWYSFESFNSMLFFGKCDSVVNELNNNFKDILYTDNVNDINKENAFDYAVIYGIEQFDKTSIQELLEKVNVSKKIIIIGNNQFGINNWSKFDISNQSGTYKIENKENNYSNLFSIKDQLNKNEFYYINVFYIFPNYKEAELIINENFKPQSSQLDKYTPLITEPEFRVLDEIKALKNIINANYKLLDFFANSYFIEASKSNIENDIYFASYNNIRKKEYRLITKIRENVVEKVVAEEEANNHIQNMKKIIEDEKNNGIEILDYYQDNKIFSKYIKNSKTLDEILFENSDNIDYIVQILNDLEKIYLNDTVSYEECKDNLKFGYEDTEMLKKLHYMKKAFWDMVPKNCFYIDNKYVFFDQEWEEDYLPAEFLLYRSIINCYDLVRKIDVNELLEKLNILEYKGYFEVIDEELRKQIIDDKKLEKINTRKIISVDNYINDNKSFKKELKKKEEYILNIENVISIRDSMIKGYKEDADKKQEYIIALEKKVNEQQEQIGSLKRKLNKIFFWRKKTKK